MSSIIFTFHHKTKARSKTNNFYILFSTAKKVKAEEQTMAKRPRSIYQSLMDDIALSKRRRLITFPAQLDTKIRKSEQASHEHILNLIKRNIYRAFGHEN